MNIISQLKLKNRHKHLLMLVKNSRLKLSIAMAFMLLSSGATSAAAYLIKHVLDDVFIARDAAMLNIIPLAFLALYALKSLSMFMSVYLMSYVDAAGQVHKPFILPQQDPTFYDAYLKTFSVPEFAVETVRTDAHRLAAAVRAPERTAVKLPAISMTAKAPSGAPSAASGSDPWRPAR